MSSPASTKNCTTITPECPLEATIYGYYPSLGANVFFAAFFGVCLLIQLLQAIKYKTWTFSTALCLGCVSECLGYVGRIMLHSNPWSSAGFELQICLLIIAPAFLSAGVYLTLKHLILTFGTEFSRLRPNQYVWIFISADLLSLVLQGAGGGTAASASTLKLQKTGADLMLSGIVWQVFSLLAFGVLTGGYFVRVWRGRQQLSPEATATAISGRFKLFALGLSIAYLTIFVRCVYRIPELSGGWSNSIMRNQNGFIILDGLMITLAVLALTAFHPGYFFPQISARGSFGKEMSTTKAVTSNGSSDVELGQR